MASTTSNIGLTKPAGTEKALVSVINSNSDIIDSAAGGLMDAIAIVANGNTHAAISAGQYVYVHNHGTLAEGLYTANSAIAANATLTTSNLTADASGGLNALNSNIATINGKIGDLNVISDPSIYKSAYNDIPINCMGRFGLNSSISPVNSSEVFAIIATGSSLTYRQIEAVSTSRNKHYIISCNNGTWSNWEELAFVKTKTVNGTTSSNGNIDLNLSLQNYTVIGVYVTDSQYVAIPCGYANTGWGAHVMYGNATQAAAASASVSIKVAYIEKGI